MEEISPGYFEAIYEGYNNQDIEVSLIFFDHTVLIELKEKSYNGFHNFSELQDLIRTMGIKMYYEYGNPEQDRLYEQDVLTLKKGISKDERVAISKVQFNEYDNRIIIYVED